MTYTTENNAATTLNDNNIVGDMSSHGVGANSTMTVTTNGVPSFELLKRTYDDFSASIDAVNDELETHAESIEANAAEIDIIKHDLKGGVNYQGQLKYTIDDNNLVQMLQTLYKNGDPTAEVDSLDLKNGWLYDIKIEKTSAIEQEEVELVPGSGFKIDDGDFLIVHPQNNADTIKLGLMSIDDVSLIDCADRNYVRQNDFDELTEVVEGLDEDVDALMYDIDELSGNLTTNEAKITSLSSALEEKANAAEIDELELIKNLEFSYNADTHALKIIGKDDNSDEIANATIDTLQFVEGVQIHSLSYDDDKIHCLFKSATNSTASYEFDIDGSSVIEILKKLLPSSLTLNSSQFSFNPSTNVVSLSKEYSLSTHDHDNVYLKRDDVESLYSTKDELNNLKSKIKGAAAAALTTISSEEATTDDKFLAIKLMLDQFGELV